MNRIVLDLSSSISNSILFENIRNITMSEYFQTLSDGKYISRQFILREPDLNVVRTTRTSVYIQAYNRYLYRGVAINMSCFSEIIKGDSEMALKLDEISTGVVSDKYVLKVIEDKIVKMILEALKIDLSIIEYINVFSTRLFVLEHIYTEQKKDKGVQYLINKGFQNSFIDDFKNLYDLLISDKKLDYNTFKHISLFQDTQNHKKKMRITCSECGSQIKGDLHFKFKPHIGRAYFYWIDDEASCCRTSITDNNCLHNPVVFLYNISEHIQYKNL